MKNTNRALLTSVVALILCCTMLVGSTFAWFTDEVTSATNNIVSGNLDVVLSNDDGVVDQNTKLFADVSLWEPGVVVYENLTVANAGNLALKYELSVNFTNATEANGKTLADVLKVGIVPDGVSGNRDNVLASVTEWQTLKSFVEKDVLKEQGDADVYGIVIYWQPSDNDNDYNVAGGLSIDLGVNLFATQYTHEDDSFDDQYDLLAPYPVALVTNADQFENVTLPWGSYGAWSPSNMDQQLESAYIFTAPHDASNIDQCKYKDWYCDYYVSLDRDLDAGQIFLGGNYGDFGWIGFENPDPVGANTEIPLLGSVVVNAWTYEAIATGVGTFTCGVARTHGTQKTVLNGATFTVHLRLTNPEDENDYVNVSTVKYTFTEEVGTAAELKDALANGTSVTLTDDVFVDEKLTIPSGKEVVLDLGGNELSGAFTQQGVSALIQNKGKLTIKNGTVTSLATNPDTDWNPEGFPTYASNTISNNGVLVIEDGAVIENQTNVGGASYAIDNYAGGTLTVNGGVIKAQDVAIRINTASTSAANTVTINGGKITGKRAIWIHIAGSNSAQAPEVNLTINGGDFNSTSDFTIYSYSYGQSFANVNVTINGGDFEKAVAFGGGYKGDQENVAITGGTFHGDLGRYLVNDGWIDIAKP